jgi:hypothetical protein
LGCSDGKPTAARADVGNHRTFSHRKNVHYAIDLEFLSAFGIFED